MVISSCLEERTARALRAHLESLLELIDDPTVEDIFANPDGKVWVHQRGVGSYYQSAMAPGDVLNIINLVASYNGTVCNADKPILEAILPFRSARFHGTISPVTVAPSFSIRLRPQKIFTLEEYCYDDRILNNAQLSCLFSAIDSYQNILLVGGTGTGKTTLLNALLDALAKRKPDDRVVSIEDTPEIQCSSPNYMGLFSSGAITMTTCVRSALRSCPTRIVVGEVRGGEALDMLKAWNTGHPGGFATVHGKSAAEGLERIEALAREATQAPQQKFIASTINLVCFLSRIAEKPYRKVQQILRVTGYEKGKHQFEEAQ